MCSLTSMTELWYKTTMNQNNNPYNKEQANDVTESEDDRSIMLRQLDKQCSRSFCEYFQSEINT